MRPASRTSAAEAAAARRVLASRALAWGTWLGAWLGLGFVGVHSGAALGGMAPLAWWLGATAVGLWAVSPPAAAKSRPALRQLRGLQHRLAEPVAWLCRWAARISVAALAVYALTAAWAVSMGGWQGPVPSPGQWAAVAPALAVWAAAALVGASLQVRAARLAASRASAAPSWWHHPLVGALLGALVVASATAGGSEAFIANPAAALYSSPDDALKLGASGVAMAATGLALLWALGVARWGAHRLPLAPVTACRRRLFDGVVGADAALPSASARGVTLSQQLGAAPLWAAQVSMVPMMATLPHMAQWCAALGFSPGAVLALHAAAMGAGASLGVGVVRWRRRTVAPLCALALGGGSALLWLWPDLRGLMAAGVLHALAWGLAWALCSTRVAVGTGASRPPLVWPLGLSLSPLALCAAVLLLGLAVGQWGPLGAMAAHAGLGVLAAVSAGLALVAWGGAGLARYHGRVGARQGVRPRQFNGNQKGKDLPDPRLA